MLEARDLSFAYDNRVLFEGLSLSVASGERVAVQAPSGFGKTTLCRVLSGYLEPQSGCVLVDGEPLPRRGVSPVQLIGQHPELTVDPRMRMRAVLEEAGPIDEAVCEALGIRAEWMRRFPHELSGGELQRFCIARALAANPRYLIADEISVMLDALTQAQVWRFLMDEVERRDMGLLFVSHVPALTQRVATRTFDLTASFGADE